MGGLTVGVVGLGLGRHFVAGCLENESVGRVVVCDPDAERVAQIQKSAGVDAGYGSLKELLGAESPDAVCVVTPDHLHRPHTEQCLGAGCHVLQTKPLATNLDDARAIVQASEKADRLLMVAHERRFRTGVQSIREILDSGALGEVVHLRIDAIQDKRGQFARSPWYASAEAGRTALVGSGIHEVDLMRFLVGRPVTSVSAYSNRMGTLEFPKDKTTSAIFQFEGGTVGQVTVTYEAHWPKGGGAIDDHFRLVGSKGMIVGGRVARDGQEGWEELPADENEIATSVRRCVHSFVRSIVEGSPVEVDGREAYASLATCAAADDSAASGWPRVPEEYD